MAEYNPSKIIKDGNTYNFRDDTKIPLAGSNQISGDLIPATTDAYDLGDSSHNYKIVYAKEIQYGLNSGVLFLGGGNGANIELYGSNASSYAGWVSIKAVDNNGQYQMILKPDGTLKWGSKNVAMREDVIPLSGTNALSGNIIPSANNTYNLGSSDYFFKNTYSNTMHVDTLISSDNTCGIVFGTSEQGKQFRPRSADNNAISLGIASVRWKEIWCTQSSINSSSDERQKQQIKPIDDDLLDAWENVNPIEFKWNDAVKEKGDNARVHTGYIAQNIQQALTENGVNPNDYGLFLYDEWGEEQEEKDEQGNIIKPYRPSGNAYGLRYTEALIVECAYLRKCIKELRNEIEQLKSSK